MPLPSVLPYSQWLVTQDMRNPVTGDSCNGVVSTGNISDKNGNRLLHVLWLSAARKGQREQHTVYSTYVPHT